MANWFHKLFYDDNDVVTTPMSRIVQEQVDIRNAMTPNERLYTMFSKDESGNMSPEMVSTVDLAITGAIGGCIVGGVANSKNAYVTWMQNNRATQFTEPLAAQRSLQDAVTKAMAKGGFMWGWRTAAFCSTYQLVSSSVATYRGKYGVFEHTLGGCGAGMIYKLNLGLRGMAVGFLLGGVLGTVAGTLSTGLCYLTGVEMDHLRYYQQQMRNIGNEKAHQALVEALANDDKSENQKLYQRDIKMSREDRIQSLEEITKVLVPPVAQTNK